KPDEDVNTEGSRFYMLTQIDKEYESYVRPAYDDKIGLKELCEDFRNFSAGSLKLYYDIEDIRRFIGGLAVTKLIILQGMSGTGKTSLAYAFGEYLDNKTVVVPIQPMWKERTDLLGYYNEFTRRFNETTLLYKMYEANNNEEIYITVLDEMNIARVEYYFAEFLSLLEIPNPDGRNLDVVADRWDDDPKLLQSNGKMKLPTNMWFIGTANNDDSTFSISDKVYDRAMVINLDKKATPFEAEGKPRKVSATHLQELMDRAQREYALSDRNLRRLKKLDEYMIKTFHITFGNRIMKQIKCYVPVMVACGGTEVEALDDILARKIFRKLESKNPVYVKQMADNVCDYLDELFGENKLALCKETMRLIEQNV
ncbi:MAG: AAA family ATPase, partial [Clostridia bacterium]|nr:AAA family ATPase [Clostridia bacterium]